MKLLVFLAFSVFLKISWAQKPTAYGVPPTDQEPTNEQARPFKDPKFNPRGHGHRGRDSNGPPDSNQPPRLEVDPGFTASGPGALDGPPRDGGSIGAPSFGPPKPPGGMPQKSAAS